MNSKIFPRSYVMVRRSVDGLWWDKYYTDETPDIDAIVVKRWPQAVTVDPAGSMETLYGGQRIVVAFAGTQYQPYPGDDLGCESRPHVRDRDADLVNRVAGRSQPR